MWYFIIGCITFVFLLTVVYTTALLDKKKNKPVPLKPNLFICFLGGLFWPIILIVGLNFIINNENE